MKKLPITWASKLVSTNAIKETPNNFKIKNALGTERFRTSLKNFGLAGNVVCNTDMVLIDGNSRLAEAKEKNIKKIWVSLPSRKLGTQEFLEMSSLFDFAKSSDVDIERVEKEIFKTKDMYARWNMAVPMELLDSMGANAKVKPNGKKEEVEVIEQPSTMKVELFFTPGQEQQFRKIEERLMKKFKTKSTTETVFKALKSIK